MAQDSRIQVSRRGFLGNGLLALTSISLLGGVLRAAPSPSNRCSRAMAGAKLADRDEPGERLHVSGRIFAPDGVTPAAGVVLYAYHTDAQGYYSRSPGASPRLRGWMKTRADGWYEYVTIKPAPYPGRTVAAHIHTQLWGDGVPPQYGPDLLFEGDPLISAAEKRASAELGRFAFIRPVKREGQGVWDAVHDIRLKSKGDRFEEETLHGLVACGLKP